MTWKTCVLVVANQTADSDELVSALSARSERGPTQFTLLLPSLLGTSPGQSEARLAEALERLRAAGLEMDGEVGDSNPLTAVKEAWDPAKYDEILVSTLPTGTSKWLQIDLPHRVERITGMPVQHVVGTPRSAVR
ncbi:MAG: hypothetical protein E6G07_07900 [Actinobacteria bacterium]|nr:MAG: hypothetical protein E6G07_07900 [Actinomycetota bacterium]